MVATATPKPLSRKRRILVWTLVILATVLALVSILTTWVNRQMLDNTAWNKATTQVIQDPQVQSALGGFMVNQLYENIDVAQALQQQLPPALKGLAPQLAGALQGPAERAVTLLLQRPRVQNTFVQASALAHEKLVELAAAEGWIADQHVFIQRRIELSKDRSHQRGLAGARISRQ